MLIHPIVVAGVQPTTTIDALLLAVLRGLVLAALATVERLPSAPGPCLGGFSVASVAHGLLLGARSVRCV